MVTLFLVAKFACFSLALDSSEFIMIMISNNFIFNFTNLCVIVSFLGKLLTLGILFSMAVTTVVVAKLVI